ncbi:MAG: YicC/YloC family endoribonuclease [Pseudomonadota bacterium]
MTAFANRTGSVGSASWSWEIRGVNARGLDLRLRLPDGIDGLELVLRKALSTSLSRGNVTVNLRLTGPESEARLALDKTQLGAVLTALDEVQEQAFAMGVTLAQPTAADVLGQLGVLIAANSDDDSSVVADALKKDMAPLIEAFVNMRDAEGAALHQLITEHLDKIDELTKTAAHAAADRLPRVKETLTAALRRVVEDVGEIEEQRIAQELALLAVKSDVTEEIDRLGAHVQAARDLLAADGPAGRKLDFLAQEFNREANTLCAKAQDATLTAIGLDLKAVIDQMREQIQNVE